MAIGLVALFSGVAWLVAQPGILAGYHYSPAAVAVTHLFVLGWVVTMVMGATYQLVPVALETNLHSERMARWHFVCHVIGFIGMVWMFRVWNMSQVGHYGCIMATGFGLFACNMIRTLLRVPKWNITAWALVSALFWISCTAVAGLAMAAAKCDYDAIDRFPPHSAVGLLLHGLRATAMFMYQFAPLGAMHAHAHLGLVGFFLMLIVGVSYKLIPMFTLSEVQNSPRAGWSIALLNLGLAVTGLAVLQQSAWKTAAGLVLMAALALYGWEMAAILRARQRKALDWGIRYFLTAISLLAPVAVMGLILSRPGPTPLNGQVENLYGFLAVAGVVTFAIIGMLYKIAPFLVWFGVYSRHIGRARVPTLGDMYSPRLQAAGYWTFLAGLAGTSAAILGRSELGVRGGCLLLAAALFTLAVNMGFILSHCFRPRLAPLVKHSTPAPAL